MKKHKEEQTALSQEDIISQLSALSKKGVTRTDKTVVLAEADLTKEQCAAVVKYLNKDNIRQITRHQVDEHIADMSGGNWAVCYDPIVFRADWSLMNGQHRVSAGAAHNGLLGVVIVFSATPETSRSIDAGRKRTIAQTHAVPNDIASCVQVVISLETGRAKAWTRAQVFDRYSKDRDVFEFYSQLFRRRAVLRESHTAATFAFAEISKPTYRDELREIAEDMAVGQQQRRCSKLIAGQIVDRRTRGVRISSQKERVGEASTFLHAIRLEITGEDLLMPSERSASTKWWLAADQMGEKKTSAVDI